MWIVVMFDLPVLTKSERHDATRFRLDLLDLGFERSQLSIYMRYCTSQTQLDTYCRRIEAMLPPGGKVHVLQFTDKQYERIISFHGGRRMPDWKTPDQFDLF
jgi:CRISPR-associated protein Cas2